MKIEKSKGRFAFTLSSFALGLLVLFANLVPDVLVDAVVLSRGGNPDTLILFTFLGIIAGVSWSTLLERSLGLILCIPALVRGARFLSKHVFLWGVPQNATHKLSKCVDMLRGREPSEKFFGRVAAQRAVFPCLTLEDKLNGTPDFVMLFRSIEELAAHLDAKKNPEHFFELLQEKDYEQLFLSVDRSYVVTSYGDHSVWAIYRERDLEYYEKNWDKHRKLRSKRRGNEKTDSFLGPDKEPSPGIHRIFVLTKREIEEEKRPDLGNLFETFKICLDRFIGGLRDREHAPAQPFRDLEEVLKVDVLDPAIRERELKFKSEPIVQLLFILLAGKIHEKLGMIFSVVRYNAIQRLDCLHLDPTNKEDAIKQWRAIGRRRLGSALIDQKIVAYADQLEFPVAEEQQEHERSGGSNNVAKGQEGHEQVVQPMMCFKFYGEAKVSFVNEAKDVFDDHMGFKNLGDPLKSLVDDPTFDKIAENLAKRIVGSSK